MDKIYSRRRAHINFFYSASGNKKKKLYIVLIVVIAILTMISLIKTINPIFENLCKDRAINISTKILNEESTTILKKYNYKDIVSIMEVEENKVLKTNVQTINEIASEIALNVTDKLEKLSKEKIKIPIGAVLGNRFLSGMGPKINISIIPSGNVTTELKTEFKSQGINQTVYRIFLEVVCNEKILTSYSTIDTQITNQVLLVETVIVGNVPETYYNLEGLDRENNIDLIE